MSLFLSYPDLAGMLIDGKLQINEEEAVAIRVIFDQYVHTDIGVNGVEKYLENHGMRKIQRQNGKNPLFDAHLLSGIVKCPVCGAGMYGNKSIKRRKDGTKYKDFYYYGCKHRTIACGHKCDYKKQLRQHYAVKSKLAGLTGAVDNYERKICI